MESTELLDIKRFLVYRKILPNTKPNGTCLDFQGYITPLGYGAISRGRRNFRAHRIVFEVALGKNLNIKELVCHHCDNRRCVNISHLFLGDTKANAIDAAQKLRVTHGERHHNAKLSTQRVMEIRALRDVPDAVLAKRYGVSKVAVAAVQRGEAWKHVKEGAQ